MLAIASGSDVVSHAGATLLLRTAARTGLNGGSSAALSGWRKPRAPRRGSPLPPQGLHAGTFASGQLLTRKLDGQLIRPMPCLAQVWRISTSASPACDAPTARHPSRTPMRPASSFGDSLVGHGVDLGSGSALSESVSKSACSFAWTSTTKRVLASSCSSCRFLFKVGDLLGLRVAPLTSARNGQPSQRAGVTGPPPRHDVAGVQALPTQQRTLAAIGSGVVGGQDLQLVLRSERPAPGTLGHLGVGAFRSKHHLTR